MEKLYRLVDQSGKYRNFIIFCRQECELDESKKEESIIYTEQQMAIAKRYFKKKHINVIPEEVTHEESDKRRLRKRGPKGPGISGRNAETDGK